MVGYRTISFYQEIERMFNVELISHKENNKKLILGSSLVIVTTGTSGLESLCLGKKTIILGSSLFSSVKSIIKIKEFEELKNVLNEEMDDHKKEDQKNDIKKFLDALINTKGVVDHEELIWTHRRDEKVKKLSKVDFDLFELLECKNDK